MFDNGQNIFIHDLENLNSLEINSVNKYWHVQPNSQNLQHLKVVLDPYPMKLITSSLISLNIKNMNMQKWISLPKSLLSNLKKLSLTSLQNTLIVEDLLELTQLSIYFQEIEQCSLTLYNLPKLQTCKLSKESNFLPFSDYHLSFHLGGLNKLEEIQQWRGYKWTVNYIKNQRPVKFSKYGFAELLS